MRSQKLLLVDQHDRKIEALTGLDQIVSPEIAWIKSVRTILNMTMEQLGRKLNITRQGVKNMEDNEAEGKITIKTLKDAANAMDQKFVYAFIPKDGSMEALIERKARELAQKIVSRTNQNMLLEEQSINDYSINKAVDDLTEEYKNEIKRIIWD